MNTMILDCEAIKQRKGDPWFYEIPEEKSENENSTSSSNAEKENQCSSTKSTKAADDLSQMPKT